MGVSSMLARVSTSSAAGSIPIGCVYLGTLFCSFLGLFAPVHAQDVQIRSTAQRVFPAALLEQYHNIILNDMTETIATLRFTQQRKITIKKKLRAANHLDLFDPLTTAQVNFIYSFILTRLPSSAKLELSLFSFACLPFP
jgi:hypothetical protein